MKQKLILSVLVLSSCFWNQTSLSGQQVTPTTIKITLSTSDQAKYRDFAKDKDFNTGFSYKSADFDSAPVLDVVLIRRALTLGGLEPNFVFVDVPNSERERKAVLSGEVVMAGTSQWESFCDENTAVLYKSSVVIPNGSFEKGLYTTKEKTEKFSVQSVKDLAAITACSSSTWKIDWATLSALGFKSLTSSPNIPTMFRIVQAGRVDVTVQSFSGNPDLSVSSEGITLYPIPGVKILLKGSRHYVVSKSNPNGKGVFEALQKGLSTMTQNNEIQRALLESGFFNKSVTNWKTLSVK